jgi:hypothetical protein
VSEDKELLKRIEKLEHQRSKTLRFTVLLASGLIALSPVVIMLTGSILFEIHSTIEEGKPRITQVQSRALPEGFLLQISAGIGVSISSTAALLSRSERFQEWIGLRVKDD